MNRAERRALARRRKSLTGPVATRELWLAPETWEVIRDQAEDFLALVEDHGIDAAEHWLRVRGLPFTVVAPSGGLE